MNVYTAIVIYRVFPDPKEGLPPPIRVTITAESDEAALGQLFERFNHAIPGVTGDLAEKFRVRSMSVGDEILLMPKHDANSATAYVVAPVGFDILTGENAYAKPGGLWNPPVPAPRK